MTKTGIIKAAAKKAGVTQEQAEAIITAALEAAADALASGESVKVQYFGTLELKDYKARTARNFKTGEPITIKARKYIAFAPSETLKSRVNA